MKKFIYGALFVLPLLSSFSGKAQFFIGGGAGINHYGGGVGILPSVQPRLGYDFKEGRISIMAGFNYSPLKKKYDFDVTYREGSSSQTVPYTENLSINNYFVHAAYRLGRMENAFRFKLIAGFSGDLISLKYKANAAIPAGYSTEENVKNVSTSGPKLDFGLGGDYRLGHGDLYFELILGLPANQSNGEYINNPTVGHQGLSIGYHFYFGNRDYNY